MFESVKKSLSSRASFVLYCTGKLQNHFLSQTYGQIIFLIFSKIFLGNIIFSFTSLATFFYIIIRREMWASHGWGHSVLLLLCGGHTHLARGGGPYMAFTLSLFFCSFIVPWNCHGLFPLKTQVFLFILIWLELWLRGIRLCFSLEFFSP